MDLDKQKNTLLRTELSLSALRNASPEQLSLACVGMFLGVTIYIVLLAFLRPGMGYESYIYPLFLQWIFPPVFALLTAGAVAGALRGRPLKQMGKTLWRHPARLMFLLLSLWMALSQTVNGWENAWGIHLGTRGETILLQLEYFLCLFPAASLISTEKWKKILLRMVQSISLILAAAEFVKGYEQTGNFSVFSWPANLTSMFVNSNYYGYFLTVAVSLSAAMLLGEQNPLWKGFSALCLAANGVILYLNSTMGAWVGTVAALLFLIVACCIRDGRLNLWGVAALGIVLVCLAAPELLSHLPGSTVTHNTASNIGQLTNDIQNLTADSASEASMHAGSGRWIIWVRCMELIRQHPLFGIGFDGIDAKGLESFTGNTRPHNEFMQYALFYGIPAAVLYFAGCLSVYLRALKYKAQLDNYTLAALTAAFGYLVGSFFGLTVYNTAPYLFLMLGLGYAHTPAPMEVSPRWSYHQTH